MAATTFGGLVKQFQLEHPSVDYLLCRQWVLDAYKRACTGRRWGFLRAEGQLTNLASREITCTVTLGSQAVTSSAAFTPTDLGRQFRVGGVGMPYSISVYTDTSTVTIDRAYAGATGSTTATILDAYVTLPEDLDSIRSLVNPSVYRPMPWFQSRELLDYWDPNRTASDSSARMHVSHRMSAIAGSTGRMLYEWWPYPTARNVYPLTYYRRPDVIADTDAFVGAFATRAEELLMYARYRAALYPGTAEQKNPGYNPAVARMHMDEWNHTLENLAVVDDDQFLQSIELIDWTWVSAGLPFDANMLRASDASGYTAWLGAGSYSY